jgi:hypothetical protein
MADVGPTAPLTKCQLAELQLAQTRTSGSAGRKDPPGDVAAFKAAYWKVMKPGTPGPGNKNPGRVAAENWPCATYRNFPLGSTDARMAYGSTYANVGGAEVVTGAVLSLFPATAAPGVAVALHGLSAWLHGAYMAGRAAKERSEE